MKIPINPQPLTPEEALLLAECYFEASTSEAEEEALRRFAASPEAADDERFEALRAVMGMTAVGRRRHRVAKAYTMRRTALKIAAIVAIALGVGFTTIQYQMRNECVAYVDGRRITDDDVVVRMMKHSLNDAVAPTETPEIESQLGDMFATFEEPQ